MFIETINLATSKRPFKNKVAIQMTKQNIPSAKTQVEAVIALEKTPLEIGDIACPINRSWYDMWKEYVDYPSCEDPKEIEMIPIDNEKIEQCGRLSSTASEGLNFYILKKATYDLLCSWFGGGPRIKLPIIEDEQGKPKAITKYLDMNAHYKNDKKTVEIHSLMKISELHDLVRKSFDIPANVETRLFDYFNMNSFTLLDDTKYVSSFHPINGEDILLDSKGEDGKWSSDTFRKRRVSSSEPSSGICSSPSSSRSVHDSNSVSSQGYAGKCGFRNMGNTCFFNSGTQCMMHTRPLMQYMLSDEWIQDLNVNNPIGMKGHLAKAFASLAKSVWAGNEGSIAPSELKSVVGRYAPQFSGWGQQDSHELILFTLDGVHEDLNRCKKKAVIEPVEGNGEDDEIKAPEAWKRHKLRNDSIIVDLIHGQLRSRLVCPSCKQVTVVFDPYMSIQMPINRPHTLKFNLTYVPFDYKEKRIQMKITIPVVSGSVRNEDISEAVSKEIGKNVNAILGVRSNSYYYSSSALSWGVKDDISSSSICYAFEIPNTESVYLPCLIKFDKAKTYGQKEIGTPFLIDATDLEKDFDKNPENAIKKIEEKLAYIWDAPDDMKLTSSMENLKSSIKPTDSGFENNQKLSIEITKSYCSTNDAKSVSKECKNVLKITATVKINGASGFSYAALLMHTVDDVESGSSEKGKETISLDSCFDYFSTPEVLDKDNQWYCPRCRQFVCAEKKLDIYSVPEIFIIQLKRFISGKNNLRKLDTYVEFPEEIDLRKYVFGPQKSEKSLKYRLYAVSNHYGSLHGGHYTAFAKVQDPDSESRADAPWYSFNDSSASPTREAEVHSSSAYVLFYERIKE